MTYLLYALIANCFFVCMAQLFCLGQAHRIQKRFQVLGVRMKSDPAYSVYNTSGFWRETRRLNQLFGDATISSILRRRD
jgi:hypothetical protein